MFGEPKRRPRPELWGGVECTVNRVGDKYFDQMERSGHADRLSDLDTIADLGIKTLRYPILWERTAPNGPDAGDWTWPDERMAKLSSLGIRPIVGLVHHGSGPANTSLLDRDFPGQLAAYAGAVAQRYPEALDYTPINEPLTTARFSALYGHWYPHAKSDREFIEALIVQCRATIEAMRAIRRINPEARLVQTEDIAQVYSTPTLAYQADFENERRWLSFDLLCGRVTRDHPMIEYLSWAGVNWDDLAYLADNPCPPGLLGINYYLTSERFLDERLERYPEHTHGGNGRDRYADVEAVRVRPDGLGDLQTLLAAAHARYGIPIAITEAHIGCTDDEQVRWLNEVWTTAIKAAEAGLPIEAVTVWSLLGAYDWDNLVTRADGHYEAGAFDVLSGHLRPTRLAEFIRSIACGGSGDPALLERQGWWRRPERLLYPADNGQAPNRFALPSRQTVLRAGG